MSISFDLFQLYKQLYHVYLYGTLSDSLKSIIWQQIDECETALTLAKKNERKKYA